MNTWMQDENGWHEIEPMGPIGFVAKLEFWMRARGYKKIPDLLAKWDERGLGK